ncbi:MAG: 1-acyl-sn-glycerol-3-phosphate acyltransferase [Bdellovibrionaceae bacterium]|nr:1-acyl-sn-glycerol-3-phosphate acyltransferase [Pseudobdellovibrionaceae bacterium]
MEKIVLPLRIIGKVVIFLTVAAVYFTSSFWIHLTVKGVNNRRRRFSDNAAKYTKLVCQLYNIKIEVHNSPISHEAGLIVGNHLGFIDILVMHSLTKALFITSEEMRRTPLLGIITEMAGCMYVDRKNRANIKGELGSIVNTLNDGFRVTLYPEATSHNGEEVLPFKRTLLSAATLAQKPIFPYCFNFKSINGQPFSMKNRDSVCWYGDMTFFASFIRSCGLKEVVTEVIFLEPYYPKPDEDRADVADKIRQMIVEKFKPVQK